jgi:3-methyladenine DNA glycosylase AlkD
LDPSSVAVTKARFRPHDMRHRKAVNAAEVFRRLKALSDPRAVMGMARYGITTKKAFGISAPTIRALAKEIGTDQRLSLKLWSSGYLEARAIASLIGDPTKVTEAQMERWVRDFDSWAVCDGCCSNLFDKTPFASGKAFEWSKRREEYVKRAGFVLMAALAVHDKEAADRVFVRFLRVIVRASTDDRNFVRKAVNWALRQIGKRNQALNRLAIQTAGEIRRLQSRSARWIAADALRELKSAAVQRRLELREKRVRGE